MQPYQLCLMHLSYKIVQEYQLLLMPTSIYPTSLYASLHIENVHMFVCGCKGTPYNEKT